MGMAKFTPRRGQKPEFPSSTNLCPEIGNGLYCNVVIAEMETGELAPAMTCIERNRLVFRVFYPPS